MLYFKEKVFTAPCLMGTDSPGQPCSGRRAPVEGHSSCWPQGQQGFTAPPCRWEEWSGEFSLSVKAILSPSAWPMPSHESTRILSPGTHHWEAVVACRTSGGWRHLGGMVILQRRWGASGGTSSKVTRRCREQESIPCESARACAGPLSARWVALGDHSWHVSGSLLQLLLVDGVCSLWFGFWIFGDFLWHHEIQVTAGKGQPLVRMGQAVFS